MSNEIKTQQFYRKIQKMSISRGRAGLICLCAAVGVCAFTWHSYKEARREVTDANTQIVTNIGSYLPQAFASLSETVRSDMPLTPDAIYSGKDARIVAFHEQTIHKLLSDQVDWQVLAQSKSGHYFTVEYQLCSDCESDQRGLDRIAKANWPIRPLTVEQAKDWLYQAGLRKEFKAEFGQDAPPKSVQE